MNDTQPRSPDGQGHCSHGSGASPMTSRLDIPKCDVATGTFTHSSDTETTPCGGEFRVYPVDLSGVVIDIYVCDEHIGNRVFVAHRRGGPVR